MKLSREYDKLENYQCSQRRYLGDKAQAAIRLYTALVDLQDDFPLTRLFMGSPKPDKHIQKRQSS